MGRISLWQLGNCGRVCRSCSCRALSIPTRFGLRFGTMPFAFSRSLLLKTSFLEIFARFWGRYPWQRISTTNPRLRQPCRLSVRTSLSRLLDRRDLLAVRTTAVLGLPRVDLRGLTASVSTPVENSPVRRSKNPPVVRKKKYDPSLPACVICMTGSIRFCGVITHVIDSLSTLRDHRHREISAPEPQNVQNFGRLWRFLPQLGLNLTF